MINAAELARSVWAVPPLAIDAAIRSASEANRNLIRHIEKGGVSVLLYGANANIQNLPPSALYDIYADLFASIAPGTILIPSVGPDFGKLHDSAGAMARLNCPAIMLLPVEGRVTPQQVEAAVGDLSQRAGAPAVVYVRRQNYVNPDVVARMVGDGSVVAVKYAVSEEGDDTYLRGLISAVGAERVFSGMGESKGIAMMERYGVAGFTAGIVCVTPRLAMDILRAAQAGDFAEARRLAAILQPLEDIRSQYSQVSILQDTVTLAGIADMGVVLPLSPITPDEARIEIVAALQRMKEGMASVGIMEFAA